MPRGDAPPERVRTVALSLFHEHGVAGTSLQMIADGLGVAKAAVYYHYKSKDDIVRAVLAPAFDGFDRLLDRADHQDEDDRAIFVVEGLARQAVENRKLYAIVLRDVTAAQLQRESGQQVDTFLRLRDVLCGSEPTPAIRVKVGIFLSGLMGPATDPGFASFGDVELEHAIADAGRTLLGWPPGSGKSESSQSRRRLIAN